MQLLPLSVVAAENGLEGKNQLDCNAAKASNLASCQLEEDSRPLLDSVHLMEQRFLKQLLQFLIFKLDLLDELQQKRSTRLFLAVWVVPCVEEACGNPGILLQIIK
eukprot:4238311-Ditylum_brightwellii.AAC.1